MWKEIIVINKHSFIDVITNSSTELFVADKDKSKEFIEEFLEENDIKWVEVRWLDDEEKLFIKYKDKLREEVRYWFKEYKLYVDDIVDDEYKKIKDNIIYIDTDKNWKKYILFYWNYCKYLNKNSIIIEWESDNSISWEGQEKLEEIWMRFHLW